MKKNTRLKLYTLGMVGVMTLPSFAGCAKTAQCNIKGEHVHKYNDSSGIVMYMDSENETYKGPVRTYDFVRTDDFVLIDKEEKKKIKIQNDNDLYPISENMEYINSFSDKYEDFIEYRYYYAYVKEHTKYHCLGKTWGTSNSYTIEIGHCWTKDENHKNLTGETRTAHCQFIGYNIEKNEKGKYEVIESKTFDSLNELLDSCEYIKPNFYKVVDRDLNISLYYEDGDEETHIFNDKFTTEELKKAEEDYAKTLEQKIR